jgi:RND family efflux transporter MFP subunit
MFVVEGQRIKHGEPLAKLIDVDAKLGLQQAEAALRLYNADVQNAHAILTAAQTALANPNELEAALADAESMLAETKLTLGNLPYLIEAARSRKQLAAENLERKERAGDAIAGRIVREAKAELTAATSALAELEARGPILEAQAAALARKQAALSEQLKLMTEQKRAVAAAEAALAAARAKRDQAQLSVDAARLNLDRMTIRSPMDGRVLTLDARPGTRLAGMDPISQQSSSAVVSLYNPNELQVRVDVRLEDVPQVRIGQPCTIECAALAQAVTGQVSWITTRADVQKNTLQVKVAIHDPPDVITPEMLGQVTFLAPPQPKSLAGEAEDPLRMLIPRSLVASTQGGGTIWIVDPVDGTARQRSIQLGRAGTESLVEVAAGIDPTAKLIVEGRETLTEGARIRVTGEEQSIAPAGAAVSQSTANLAQGENVQTN